SEVLHGKDDTQRYQPLERRTRLVAEPSYHWRIDAPLIDLRVVVEHCLRRVANDAGGTLHTRARGEEPSTRQCGRSTQLCLTIEEHHACPSIVRGDGRGHAGRAPTDDDDVVVGHRGTLAFCPVGPLSPGEHHSTPHAKIDRS